MVRADCQECGGYSLDLKVPEPDRRSLAQARAEAFLRRVHSNRCLGCHANAQRAVPRGAEYDPYLWWDTQTSEWMAWVALPGSPDGGVAMPLGVRSVWALPEARAALTLIEQDLPLPIRIAESRRAVDPDVCSLFHDSGRGRWIFWAACSDCGGCEIKLTPTQATAYERACEEACAVVDRMAADGCPHCRSEREWAAWVLRDESPRLWYDTRTGEWVVWQPVEGTLDGVTLPLGLTRYDVDLSVLFRAASDAVVGDWSFEEEF